jgi:hypothetical protein
MIEARTDDPARATEGPPARPGEWSPVSGAALCKLARHTRLAGDPPEQVQRRVLVPVVPAWAPFPPLSITGGCQ